MCICVSIENMRTVLRGLEMSRAFVFLASSLHCLGLVLLGGMSLYSDRRWLLHMYYMYVSCMYVGKHLGYGLLDISDKLLGIFMGHVWEVVRAKLGCYFENFVSLAKPYTTPDKKK